MEDSVIPQIIPFDPTKKKKKKKAIDRLPVNDSLSSVCLASDQFDSIANGNEGEDGVARQVKCPWEGSDRDYHYQELLHRVYSLQNENIPELAGNKRRTFMKPAQVIQEGNMTTVIVNFIDLCNIIHRQPDHVMTFMLGEIGANGYLDGQRRFIVQGRFVPTNLEEIFHRYIEEYVLCRICRSPDTVISADRHVYFLGCEQCGSERSLLPINLTQTRRQKILI